MQDEIDTPNKGRVKIPPSRDEGGLCMKGGIYSDQKCPLCGKKFVDNHRNGLQCTQHPEQKAASFKVNFPIGENEKLTRRFKNYQEASRLLNFIRAQVDKGIFVSMYSQNLRKLLTS